MRQVRLTFEDKDAKRLWNTKEEMEINGECKSWEEFNLSEEREKLLRNFLCRIHVSIDDWKRFKRKICEQDKEFIRLLKEISWMDNNSTKTLHEIIDKLAGEDLI